MRRESQVWNADLFCSCFGGPADSAGGSGVFGSSAHRYAAGWGLSTTSDVAGSGGAETAAGGGAGTSAIGSGAGVSEEP